MAQFGTASFGHRIATITLCLRSSFRKNRSNAAAALHRFAKLAVDFTRVISDFVKIDLQTALRFSGIAIETTDTTKKKRPTLIARRAYDVMTRFLSKTHLGENDLRIVASGLERLKRERQQLGETFLRGLPMPQSARSASEKRRSSGFCCTISLQ